MRWDTCRKNGLFESHKVGEPVTIQDVAGKETLTLSYKSIV
jgi:hypothetical protein